jgi:hypothetical protein
MNWTSTKVPLWQIDCENFRKAGTTMELRDVTTEEHASFVKAFGERYGLRMEQDGTTVRFIGRNEGR